VRGCEGKDSMLIQSGTGCQAIELVAGLREGHRASCVGLGEDHAIPVHAPIRVKRRTGFAVGYESLLKSKARAYERACISI